MDVERGGGGDAPDVGTQHFDRDKARMFLSLRWLGHYSFCSKGDRSAAPKDLLPERPTNGYQAGGTFRGLHLGVTLLASLASGDLYRRACATLFPQWTTEWKGHATLLQALLSNCGILVVSEEGAAVGEAELRATRPFNIAAHLALIDSIMAAVVAEQTSVNEIAQAIRLFHGTATNVKVPSNHEDALMLWMSTAASSTAATLGMPTVADAIRQGTANYALALALTIAAYQSQLLDVEEVLHKAAASGSFDTDAILLAVKDVFELNFPDVPFDMTAGDLEPEAAAELKCHLAVLASQLFIALTKQPTQKLPPPAAATNASGASVASVNGTAATADRTGHVHSPGGSGRPASVVLNGGVHHPDVDGRRTPTIRAADLDDSTTPAPLPAPSSTGLSPLRYPAAGDSELTSSAAARSTPPATAKVASAAATGGSVRPPSPGARVGDRLLTVSPGGGGGGPLSSPSSAIRQQQQPQQHSEAMADGVGPLRSWQTPSAGGAASGSSRYHAAAQQSEPSVYGSSGSLHRSNGPSSLTGDRSSREPSVPGTRLDFGQTAASPVPAPRQASAATAAMPATAKAPNSGMSRSILSLQEKWKKESEVKGRLGASAGGAVSPVNFPSPTSDGAPVLLSPSRDDPTSSSSLLRGDADGRTDGHGSSASGSPSSSPSPNHRDSAERASAARELRKRTPSPFGPDQQQLQDLQISSDGDFGGNSSSVLWSQGRSGGQNSASTPTRRPDVAAAANAAWSASAASAAAGSLGSVDVDSSYRYGLGAGSSATLPRRPEQQAAWAAGGAYSSHQTLHDGGASPAFRGQQHLVDTAAGASSTLPRKPATRSSPLKAFMAATASSREQGESPSTRNGGGGGGGGGLMSSSQLRRVYGSMSSINLAGVGADSSGRASPGLLLANRLMPASNATTASATPAAGAVEYSRSAVKSPLGFGGSSSGAGKNQAAAFRASDEGFPADGQGHVIAHRQPSWDSNRSFSTGGDRPASPMSSGTASSGRTTPAAIGSTATAASSGSAAAGGSATRKRATWNRVSPAGDNGAGGSPRGLDLGGASAGMPPETTTFANSGSFGQPSDDEMARMKERVMLMELRRKEESERRRLEKEAEAQERREQQRQLELAAEKYGGPPTLLEYERKKQEEKQRRERIYEQHQQSKREDQDRAQAFPFGSSPPVALRPRSAAARAASRNSTNRHSYAGVGGAPGALDFYSSLSNIAEHPMSGEMSGGPAAAAPNVFERLTAPSPAPVMTSSPSAQTRHQQQNGGGQYYGQAFGEPAMSHQHVGMSSTLTRYGSMSSLSGRAPTPSFGHFERPLVQEGSAVDPLKLFAVPGFKSNRSIIINAISHCVLPGGVNADVKNRVLEDIARSDAKHLLILFRDARLQYRGVYAFNIDTGEATKVCGQGPKTITEDMLEGFYKYNSGSKSFSVVTSTRHLSVTIDAMTIKDLLWQKPVGPVPPPPVAMFRRMV